MYFETVLYVISYTCTILSHLGPSRAKSAFHSPLFGRWAPRRRVITLSGCCSYLYDTIYYMGNKNIGLPSPAGQRNCTIKCMHNFHTHTQSQRRRRIGESNGKQSPPDPRALLSLRWNPSETSATLLAYRQSQKQTANRGYFGRNG